jgi:alpha-ribazole phosphatase
VSTNSTRELLLIRHGTTDLAGKLCGHLDPPLNSAGRDQASGLVLLLRDRNIQFLYVSDLARAIQTAEYIGAGLGLPLLVHTDLREISFGEWEGKRWSDLKAGPLSAKFQSFESAPDGFAPGGESFLRFRERVMNALKEIASLSDGRAVAVVTHMGVIRVALRQLANVDDTVLSQTIPPCGVYRFAVTGDTFRYTGQLTSTSSPSQPTQHP